MVMTTRSAASPPHRWRGGAFRTLSMISSMAVLDGVVRGHVDLELHDAWCVAGGALTRRLRLGLLEIHAGEEVGDGLGGEVLHRALAAHQLDAGGGRVALLLDEPTHAPRSPDDALQRAHELG